MNDALDADPFVFSWHVTFEITMSYGFCAAACNVWSFTKYWMYCAVRSGVAAMVGGRYGLSWLAVITQGTFMMLC